jgi:hypothetical protein
MTPLDDGGTEITIRRAEGLVLDLDRIENPYETLDAFSEELEAYARWPPGLDVGALMQQSEETEPGSGIYVITRRGETEKAGEEVRV